MRSRDPHFFSQFYYRRALRIFPVYFVSLALLLVFLPWITGTTSLFPEANRNQLYLWTFTSNLKCCFEGAWCFGYLDHFWSLAIEEQFYIAWPLIVFMLSTKLLLRFSMMAIVLSVVTRTVYCMLSTNHVFGELFTLFRCDGLLLGACVAILQQTDGSLTRYVRSAFIGLFVFAITLGTVGLIGLPLLRLPTSFVAFIWTTLLMVVLTTKPNQMLIRIFESIPFRTLGKHSYAMYVIQNPLIPLVSLAGLWPMLHASVLGGVAYILVMSFVTFVASVATWYLIEVWFLKLR